MPPDTPFRPLRAALAAVGLLLVSFAACAEEPADWRGEFPIADFDRRSIEYAEIVFDGAVRDSIPPIADPKFVPAAEAEDIGPLEPVLSIGVDGDFRAYPLRILLWHEIVNDVVGGVPVLVSYCPLCNSGVVFDRRVGGRVLEFGNTGRIRHFDMVMYDTATEALRGGLFYLHADDITLRMASVLDPSGHPIAMVIIAITPETSPLSTGC